MSRCVPTLTHGAISAARLASGTADCGHVPSILANDFTAAAARDARFVGRELVSAPLSMRSLAAFAGDFALPSWVHRRESTAPLDGL